MQIMSTSPSCFSFEENNSSEISPRALIGVGTPPPAKPILKFL